MSMPSSCAPSSSAIEPHSVTTTVFALQHMAHTPRCSEAGQAARLLARVLAHRHSPWSSGICLSPLAGIALKSWQWPALMGTSLRMAPAKVAACCLPWELALAAARTSDRRGSRRGARARCRRACASRCPARPPGATNMRLATLSLQKKRYWTAICSKTCCAPGPAAAAHARKYEVAL